MLRLIPFFFLLLLTVSSFAQGAQQLIDQWCSDPELANASIAIQFRRLSDEKVLGEKNPELAVIPASNMKLLTTSAALTEFGEGYQFTTQVAFTGTINDGVLDGDLIIIGGGDPTLGSKYFGGSEKLLNSWVKTIQAAGIQKVTGKIMADASIYPDYNIPRTWIWEDMGNYYGAGVSGLTFSDNTYYLTFKTGSQAKQPTQLIGVEPEIPGLTHDNQVLTSNGNRDNAYIFGGPYRYNRLVMGTLPKNKSSYTIKGSMPDPVKFLTVSFIQAMQAQGMEIVNPEPIVDAKQVRRLLIYGPDINGTPVSTMSPTLAEIVKNINVKSNNLFAEHLFTHLARENYVSGLPIDGSQSIEDYLENIGVYNGGVNVVDGSGMSRFNTITARTQTELLVHASNAKISEAFTNSLAVAGQSGTLKSFLRGSTLDGKLKGKSGYMERVRSYSGYLPINGEAVAFCVIVNNYSCSAGAMKKKIESLLLQVAQSKP